MAALLYAMMFMEWRRTNSGAPLACQLMLCEATGYQECTVFVAICRAAASHQRQFRGAFVNDANPFAGSMKTFKCRRRNVHDAPHLTDQFCSRLAPFGDCCNIWWWIRMCDEAHVL